MRLEFPGALYHVAARGNARQDIYLDDWDRRQFLQLYAQVADRLGWLCHAYCLMNNHYHFVLETPRPNLSRGMRQLNSNYAQCFNVRHHRVGHLFQGRFKAILVQRQSYLLELVRYVVLNPTRAGLTGHPKQWSWSSYRATAGIDDGPRWLTTSWILAQLGLRHRNAQLAYRAFVADGTGMPGPWVKLRGQIYLGDESFEQELKRTIRNRNAFPEVPRVQRTQRKTLATYEREAESPSMAMLLAYDSGTYSLKEIATYFRVHYSTASKWIKRARQLRN